MERRRRKLENAEERLAKITGQPIHSIGTGIVFHSLFKQHVFTMVGRDVHASFQMGKALSPFGRFGNGFRLIFFI